MKRDALQKELPSKPTHTHTNEKNEKNMTDDEQWWPEAEDSFASDHRHNEHREYDYKLKRETVESFLKFINERMGPQYITNNDIEQWLKDNS